MIVKLLKKQAKPAEAPTASLADRIREICAEADAYIEQHVRQLKQDPDCQLLPIDWLDQDLRRRNGGHCSCRVALNLLAKDRPND